ncbi:sensor domain-containing diguanylate cyclase [Paenibacillus sp.]|uniref:sensor domain-containing diguanylate cyclase n=1 Tax=Paenibacillus sp. TaxID=58172 RepID=UPI002D3CC0C9|nr:sensor domain-containing diguanylate cyclase [Paenibacillus sp.]HZG83567.1 sensor domain-containing diguanylate cyclase [Paenibacillus sp.]
MILFSGLVFLSVLTTTVIQLAVGYRSERELLYDTTLELNQENAQKMAVTMDAMFTSMRSTLQYGADAMTDLGGEHELRVYLDLLRNGGRMFNSLVLADDAGVVVGSSPDHLGIDGKRLTSKAAVEALRLKAPYMSQPYIALTGRMIVLITEPVYGQGGDYRGFLAGTVYLQEDNVLSDAFGGRTEEASGTYAYIVDKDGFYVYHPDPSLIGERMAEVEVAEALSREGNGHLATKGDSGDSALAGYATVESNGWSIAVQTPVEAVEAELRRHTLDRLMFLVPSCLALLAVAVYLARRMAEPFVALSVVARKLTSGGTVPESLLRGHWNREADTLGKTMLLALRSVQEDAERLTTEAMTDPLTGLGNRRSLREAIAGFTAGGGAFAVLILDIDRFKSINDTFGHGVGDEVLRFLSGVVRGALPSGGTCYRLGGEEFVVLLAGADAAAAFPSAERIRGTLERTPSPTGASVTVSIGVADYPERGADEESLLVAADAALYEAKAQGRNRTIIAKKDRP